MSKAKAKSRKNSNVGQNNTKILRLFGDISFIAILLSCAFAMTMIAITMAKNITITVGK